MKISAHLENSKGKHEVIFQTNDNKHSMTISPKPDGFGSSINGGELLFLAIATCYCNDIYREAAKRKIKVSYVEVTVEGEFGKEGEPAKNILYEARITADATKSKTEELMRYTDSVTEIQNTIRAKVPVFLSRVEAETSSK
ncbi:MAG TPA: OsmC family protein [Ignavibacteriaceae bacterium]|nr:OsmC family protein [Ignavibacteriaceae bacterium]